MAMSDAHSKKALITGASSGLGAEFARQLAGRGYDLILHGRRVDRLAALAAELNAAHGIAAEPLSADLAEPAGVAAVEQRIAGLESLALLINNAGFGISKGFAAADVAGQADMLNVHMMAPMRLTHAVLPGMLARRSGGIINVSSLAAFVALPGNINYCATKAYLLSFSQALAGEVRRRGVHVQALCPGFTVTEFQSRQPTRGAVGPQRAPRWMWGSVSAVVSDSLAALDRGQVVCVPGVLNRMIVLLARTGLINRLASRVLRV